MLVQRPPMGWNTWNTFGKDINEAMIRESADAFIDYGLKDAGYEYLVIDDCWSEYNRDPVTDRIVPDHVKFPNGMKVVADYVHSKGLKFGMYSCDGVRTCADYPGSFDHEFLDAQMFAEFGVDYLKYDNCYKPNNASGPSLYRRMAMALRSTGRDILFSACNWGTDDVWTWIRGAGAHMYRSTGDIHDSAESYRNIIRSQIDKFGYSAPGCYNDIDMLTVGMYGKGLVGSVGCNDADYRSQFALWCMFSAPLMLGCDIRHMNQQTIDLVTNRELIKIDQDPECRPPISRKCLWNDDALALLKMLDNNEYAIGFFNIGEKDASLPMLFAEFGLPAHSGYGFKVKNVFTGEDAGVYKEYLRVPVPAHDCVVYRAQLVRV